MRTSPRSEQRIPQFQNAPPTPVIEISSLDLLMMADEVELSPEEDDYLVV